MVYTVTFNPALDYVVRMSSFEAGATNRTESDELQWLEHRDYAMAHRLGAATGSATAFSEGLATKEQVLELLNSF